MVLAVVWVNQRRGKGRRRGRRGGVVVASSEDSGIGCDVDDVVVG